MANETIMFEHLGIEVPCPARVTVFNEGCLSKYEFMNRYFSTRFGRLPRLNEEDSLKVLNPLGTCRSYEYEKNGVTYKNVHLFVSDLIAHKSHLGFFIGGHEETHALFEAIPGGVTILKKKISLSSAGYSEFSILDEEVQANIGGIYSLDACGVRICDRSDLEWREFLRQSHPHKLLSRPEIRMALEFFKKHKR